MSELSVNVDEQEKLVSVDEMRRRILAAVPGETEEKAGFVAKELKEALGEIHDAHLEFSQLNAPSRQCWFVAKVQEIAGKYGAKVEEVYGGIVKALGRRQEAMLKDAVKGETEVASIDLGNYAPDRSERSEAENAMGGMTDAISELNALPLCEVIDSEGDMDEVYIEGQEDRDAELVKCAMDSPLLSHEEEALKYKLAVENYIAMRSDENFAGSPVSCAIQSTVITVEQQKRLYLMQKAWQEVYDKYPDESEVSVEERIIEADEAREAVGQRLAEWCKEGFVAGIVTAFKRALEHPFEYLGERMLSIPGNTVLRGTFIQPVVEEIFGIELCALNRRACGWLMKQARHVLTKPLQEAARKVYPVVKTVAMSTAQATVQVAKAVAKKTVSAAKGLYDVACKVTSSVGHAVGNVVKEGIRAGARLVASWFAIE